jgi:YaiO family outer membrane protein
MRRQSTLVAVLSLLVASPAAGQGSAVATSLQVDAAYEHLSGGLSPWRTAGVSVQTERDSGGVFRAGVRESVRFSRLDHEVSAGVQRSLTSRLTASLEAELSPSHHVLPQWAALGRMQVRVGGGWVVQEAFQHRSYEAAAVQISSTTVERYLGPYRAAYTLYVAALDGLDTAFSHRADGTVYYGARTSSIGVSISAGEELENVQPIGILRTPVRSLALTGKHWLTPEWFVAYDTLVHEQGALYQRRRVGLRLGRRF